MQVLFIYLLKVIACSGLLLGYYWIALRNKQFHQYNRFYLLFAVVLSITLPLLQLEWFTVESENAAAVKLMEVIYLSGDETYAPVVERSISWQQVVGGLFLLSFLLLLSRLLSRVIMIYRLKKRYPCTSLDTSIQLVETDLPDAPFSFLSNLFWRTDIDLNEAIGQQILQHEITHIREKHTWDKLFLQSVLCLFWMNPFFWLLQRELYLIHEFIADKKAVRDNDTSAFAAMLLHAQFGPFRFSPAQPFFYSPIKRRLLMLTTSNDARYSYTRRVMVLPLLAVTCTLFAVRIQAQQKAAETTPPPATIAIQQEPNTVSVAKSISTERASAPKVTQYKLVAAKGVADTTKVRDLVVTGYRLNAAGANDTTRFGTYKGQQVKDVFINADHSKVMLTLADESTASLSYNEAVSAGIKLPRVVRSTGSARTYTLQLDSAKRKPGLPVTITADGKKEQPLYLYDKKIISPEEMKAINPTDIHSINVLKGESATALYGDKGKNGVVFIISKANQGKIEAPKADTLKLKLKP